MDFPAHLRGSSKCTVTEVKVVIPQHKVKALVLHLHPSGLCYDQFRVNLKLGVFREPRHGENM